MLFTRIKGNGVINKRDITYRRSEERGSFINPIVNDGDIIYIGKSSVNIAKDIFTNIFSPLLNAATAYKVLSD